MCGTVYLAGGGSAAQETNVWEPMLAGVSRLLYWPVALSGQLLDHAETWLQKSLGQRPELNVTTWLDLAQHHRAELDDFDLVFVGGGNTYDLMARIRQADMAPAVRRHLQAGGAYYGGSAGAIAAGRSIGLASGLDPDRHGDPDDSGLDLVPLDVLPHFTPARAERATAWSTTHPERPVVCIPEASGVCCSGLEIVVLGPEPVDVYFAETHAGQFQQDDTICVSAFG